MSYGVWDDKKWADLIYAIRQKNCILMLGPDAAGVEVDGTQRVLTEILAEELAEEIDPEERKKINLSDLTQVAQYYYESTNRNRLERKVFEFYEERKNLCSKLHQDLAAVPFYFTVTTTPDNMFLEALKKEGKVPIKGLYNFKGKNPGLIEMGTVDKPLVFYLYGSLAEPSSLLLTENDLLDFLVALISEKPRLPRNILSELQDEFKVFLFLGFGFRQWYMRILLHMLQCRNKKSDSFVMEQFSTIKKDTDQLSQTLFFFQRCDYKIHMFKMEFDDFAAQLREKFEHTPPVEPPRVTHEGMPEVFICHASEDKDSASFLHEKLEAAGLNPWLDKENLRGGDDWHQKIKETLDNVDYIIVIQSKALAKKQIGYVNREINYALERRLECRRGTRFIIPVKIDDSPSLQELADIQYIDLSDKSNIFELIDTIKRDFEKRRCL